MFRLMAKYEMTPQTMEEWIEEWPNFLKTIQTIPTEMVIENVWVSTDRTQFFFVRSLESEEANKRSVEEFKDTDWFREKCGSLMARQEHTTWELEASMPKIG